MQVIIQQLLIGLSVGATYALIALGYTMVYGVLRLINFAHGEIYMVGAVCGYYLARLIAPLGWSPWISIPMVFAGAMVVCAAMGFVIEYFAYRPLRHRPRLVVLITAIGVSLLLQNLAQLGFIFGPTPRTFPTLMAKTAVLSFSVGGSKPVTLSNLDCISLGLSLVLMITLTWIVLRTRTGLALRAVSFRFDTAMLMGINTGRIISFTFMFGSALAAVAGVLDAMRYNVGPLMGVQPGLKAFIAAVLGGIGSIPGALLGGMLMGLIETLLKGVILRPEYTSYTDAVAFLLLILVLLIKPTGLLGRPTTEKV